MMKLKRGSTWIWILIILLVITVGVGIYFWLSGDSGSASSVANSGSPALTPPSLPD